MRHLPAARLLLTGLLATLGAGELAAPAVAPAAISFGTANQYAAGAGSFAVEPLDTNRDEVTDLAVLASSTPNILYGLGPGDFGIFSVINPDINPGQGLVAARFDRDRDTDLALVNDSPDPNRVAVLRSRGDGTFRAPRNNRAGEGPTQLAAGDFDGDGNRDLVASSLVEGRVSALFGRGDGTFASARSVNVGVDTQKIAAGDLNRDGRADFAAVNDEDQVELGFGRGNREFRRPAELEPGADPYAVEIADLDENGRRDVVVTQSPNGNDFVSVFWRRKRGFAAPTPLAIGANVSPQSLALGDLNGDGLREIVTGNAGDSVTVFENTGGRTFAGPVTLAAGNEPQDVEVARIDSDGLRDIVTANNLSGDVSILLNAL